MVNSTELQIGNWIQWTPGPENVKFEGGNNALLEALKDTGVKFEVAKIKVTELKDGHINGHHESQFEPIHLSTELLMKNGAKKGFDDSSIIYEGVVLNELNKTTKMMEYQINFENADGSSTSINLKYLHELQNVFFLLFRKRPHFRFE